MEGLERTWIRYRMWSGQNVLCNSGIAFGPAFLAASAFFDRSKPCDSLALKPCNSETSRKLWSWQASPRPVGKRFQSPYGGAETHAHITGTQPSVSHHRHPAIGTGTQPSVFDLVSALCVCVRACVRVNSPPDEDVRMWIRVLETLKLSVGTH